MNETAVTNGEFMRLAVVTTSRADFGIYRPVLKQLAASERISAGLVVSGMHLANDFGMTINEVRRSGFDIWAEAAFPIATDNPEDIALSCGQAVEAIGRALSACTPDMVMVLGDRYEMMAGALAASLLTLPIAHIHGGDETTGAFDNALRHAITKLSHLHFTATPLSEQRVLQMGESREHVFCCGAPSIDNLVKAELLGRNDFLRRLGMSDAPYLLATFHSETLSLDHTFSTFDNMWEALVSTGLQFLITATNADTYGLKLNRLIAERSTKERQAVYVDSLGTDIYPSAMRYARAMVGNSSSGIIEAAYFRLPVVNIGGRQGGRERASNVIDTSGDLAGIKDALATALSERFVESLRDIVNPYGHGTAGIAIRKALEEIRSPKALLVKKFVLMGGP